MCNVQRRGLRARYHSRPNQLLLGSREGRDTADRSPAATAAACTSGREEGSVSPRFTRKVHRSAAPPLELLPPGAVPLSAALGAAPLTVLHTVAAAVVAVVTECLRAKVKSLAQLVTGIFCAVDLRSGVGGVGG